MSFWVLIYRIAWIAVAILIVVGIVFMFLPQIEQSRELQRKEAQLQEEIRLEEELLQHLKRQQDRLRSDPRFIEKIAREELGLAKPGETVFKFVDEEPPPAPSKKTSTRPASPPKSRGTNTSGTF
jgi:cell division protein FtsB